MNPTSNTLKFVGVAAVSTLIAFGAWNASQPSHVEGYGDVGQEFFTDFDDVTKVTALTVVDYDDEEKDVMTFAVKQSDNGLWVIPSHHDYPAEAADRLAKTATSLLGVKKTAVKSRSKDDWKRFGVVEPSEDGAATAEERGTRLTLSDGSGNPLVDLIIGSPVEGKDRQYHVREPEKNTTYIAELDVDLSAKFSDWIEPDLLKISATDIVQVTLDNYSINEERGTVEKKEVLEFVKADLKTAGDWTLAGIDDETEELDNSPITSIATNLDQLKIVGVRPKPEGLDDNMRVNPVVKQLLQSQMQSLGYFIGGDKDGKERLYSNEGELVAGTEKGVEYTLYFGEIARGSDKDIEVGLAETSDESEKKDEGDDAAADDSEDGPRRYLLVKAGFNEALLGKKPVAPVEPVKPEILEAAKKKEEAKGEEDQAPAADAEEDDACGAEDEDTDEDESSEEESESVDEEKTEPDKAAAKETKADDASSKDDVKSKDAEPVVEEKKEETPKVPEKDPMQVAQEQYDAAMKAYASEKSTFEADLKKHEDRVKEGQETADELALRFSGWYYVISSDSFEKFRVTRQDVVSKKEEKKEDEKAAASKDGDK